MESAGLERLARAKLRSMSGGERQRAYVLASTVGSPDLLILDEPTVGVDAEHRLAIHEMLRLCPARHVIVTSHLPDDLAALGADRTVVLAAGRVAFDGPVAELEATVGPDPAHSRIDRALVAVARGSAAA
jgi:ABC-type multidrug transport system ATPase subunit